MANASDHAPSPALAEYLDGLHKTAAALRAQGDEVDRSRMIKAGHIITAAKGLEVMRNKLRGWYELVP